MSLSRTERSTLARVAAALQTPDFDPSSAPRRTKRDKPFSTVYYRELALLLHEKYPAAAVDILEPIATYEDHESRELFQHIAIRNGFAERAVSSAKRVLDEHQNDWDAEYHYALALAASGREEAALEHFTRVREHHPEEFNAWRDCLVSLNVLSKRKELADLGLEALRRFIDTEHSRELFSVISSADQPSVTIEAGKLFLARYSDADSKVGALPPLAMAYASEGDREKALDAYSNYATLVSDETRKIHLNVAVLETLGDFEEALKAFDNLLRASPQDDHFRLHCGILAARAGDYRSAGNYFRAINKEGEFAAARSRNRAALYIRRKNYSKALAEIDKALKITDFDWRLQIARAQALIKLGRPEEAQQSLEAARKSPEANDDLAYITTQAAIHCAEGRFQAAGELLSNARSEFPNDPWLRYNLGFVLLQQERADEARTLFAGALELDDDVTFRLGVGYCDAALGRFDRARQWSLEICESDSEDWRCWHLLALVTMGIAKSVDVSLYDDALSACDKALRLLLKLPNDRFRMSCEADLQRLRAQCAAETDNYSTAIRALRRSDDIETALGRSDVVSKINIQRIQRHFKRTRSSAVPQAGMLASAASIEALASVFLKGHLLTPPTFASISVASLALAAIAMVLPTIAKVKVPGVEFERIMNLTATPLTLESSGALAFSAHALQIDAQAITPLIGYDLRKPEPIPASTVELTALPPSSIGASALSATVSNVPPKQ